MNQLKETVDVKFNVTINNILLLFTDMRCRMNSYVLPKKKKSIVNELK